MNEIVQYLRQAAEVAQQCNALLLLENEPACNAGYATEVAGIVRAVASSKLKALWDLGNEAYGRRSAYPEGYAAIQDVVHHVHLKDVSIDHHDGTPHCVPIGQGLVPFGAQLDALRQDGYPGLYTIETHFTPKGGSMREGSEMSLRGLQGLVLVIMNEAGP